MINETKSITNAFDVDVAQITAAGFIVIVFIICAAIILGIYLDKYFKNKQEHNGS